MSRQELEAIAREVGAKIAHAVRARNENAGFALLVFDFGDSGSLAYVSNAQRQDVFASLVEWLEHHVDVVTPMFDMKARMDLADRLRQLALKIGAPR